MENISLKLEEKFLKEIERIMARHRYITKTEFIREAIRDKIKYLEKQDALRKIDNLFGSSKKKISEEGLHKLREDLADEYEKRFK